MSLQQTIEDCVGKKPLFRYSFGFHYKSEAELLQWIRDAFDIWHIVSYEISTTGLKHIQGYGERSTEFTKGDKQVFQGKGKYSKYLNTDVKKRWWCTPSRCDRQRNVMYVLKDVEKRGIIDQIISVNPHLDPSNIRTWVQQSTELQEEISGVAPSSFPERLKHWYSSIPRVDRPTDIISVLRLAYQDEVIPWRHFKTPDSVAAAEYLLASKFNPEKDDFINRKMNGIQMYLEKYNVS